MHHVVIINKNILNHKYRKFIKEMENTFISNKYSYTFHYTKEVHELKSIITSYEEKARFYLLGGDGTFHQSLQYLVKTLHETVLIPCGTGNDFSRMLKHHKNIYAHFYDSLKAKANCVDVLKVNDHYCLNTACFSIDRDIANHVHDDSWRFIPKKVAYLVSAIRRLFVYQTKNIHISIDQKPSQSINTLFFTCNNARYYGGGFCFTPNACLDDGKMDICMIDSFKRWKILYKLFWLVSGHAHKLKEYKHIRCDEIKIMNCDGVNIDGEDYVEDQVQIKVIPASFLLVNEQKY